MNVVQDMYDGSLTAVKSVVGVTEYFKVEVGLHQGLAEPLPVCCADGQADRQGEAGISMKHAVHR